MVCVDAVDAQSGSGMFTDAFGNVSDGQLELNACGESRILYNINGEFTTFKGTFTTAVWTRRSAAVDLVVSADGVPVFEKQGYTKEEGPLSFEVDVTGKTTLEITARDTTEGGEAWVYLTNDQLN